MNFMPNLPSGEEQQENNTGAILCQACGKKLGEIADGWTVIDRRKFKMRLFATGVMLITCHDPRCKAETAVRLTSAGKAITV